MTTSTPFVLGVQLSPLPDPDADWITLAVSLLPRVDVESVAEQTLKKRFEEMRRALENSPMPEVPESPAWRDVERAFGTHLGELLTFTWDKDSWRFVLTNGVAGFGTDSGKLHVVPFRKSLLAEGSELAVQHGVLVGLEEGTEGFDEKRLNRVYAPVQYGDDDSLDIPSDGFVLNAFLAQSSRLPAPLPQTALRNVFMLRALKIDIGALERTDQLATWLYIVVEFKPPGAVLHEGREDLDKKGAEVDDTFTYKAPANASIMLELKGLALSPILAKSSAAKGYLDPFETLWLKPTVAGELGDRVEDRDWQSRLPAAVENAADVSQLLLEAVRAVRDEPPPDGTLIDGAADWFRAVVATLRDTLGPGLICDKKGGIESEEEAPLAAELVNACRRPDDDGTFDLFADKPDDPAELERWHMIEAVRLYVAQGIGVGEWIELLREAVEELRELLPPVPELAGIVNAETPQQWVERLEQICGKSLDPQIHSVLLVHQWRKAVAAAGTGPVAEGARKFLDTYEKTLRELVIASEAARLARRDAALDLVPMVARWHETKSVGIRLREQLARHVDSRLSPDSQLFPRVDQLNLAELKKSYLPDARELAATTAMKEILPERMQRPPDSEPQPLVLTVDTLNDGGKQAGAEDINRSLRGYGAFVRWKDEASKRVGPWSNPLLGGAQMFCWSEPYVLKDAGDQPLQTLGQKEATAVRNIRDNTLRLDNRLWLHERDTGETAGEAGDYGKPAVADQLAVVAAETGFESRPPRLAFGLTYEFAPFAITREGGIPQELAQESVGGIRLPYLWKPMADLETWLSSHESLRRWRYLRTVGVGALRMRIERPPDAPTGPNRNPFEIAAEQPIALRAFDPQSASIEARQLEHTPPACVLLSDDGAPGPVPDLWNRAALILRAPQCSAAVYDRWVAADQYRKDTPEKPVWSAWRQRVEESEEFRRRLLATTDEAERRKQGFSETDTEEKLEDPAVEGIAIRWVRWKDGQKFTELVDLRFEEEPQPPTPIVFGDSMDHGEEVQLLAEPGRVARVPVSVQVRLGKTSDKPIDATSSPVVVTLGPGELGELQFFPAVPEHYFVPGVPQRFDGDIVTAVERPLFEYRGKQWRLFTPQRLRVEVATAECLAQEELYRHCRTKVTHDGAVEVWWDRRDVDASGNSIGGGRGFDNVASLRVAAQAWRSAGKPLSAFPHSQPDLDQLPHEDHALGTSHAVMWDAEGFAERDEDATTAADARRVAVREMRARIWSENAHPPFPPRYLRLQITARQRYAELYRFALNRGNILRDVVANAQPITAKPHFNMKWRRAYRPGRWQSPVPRPLVKLVVPLTRPWQSAELSHSADLLVFLNEEWGTVGGLAESLEAHIDSVERRYPEAGNEIHHVTRREVSRDVIVSAVAQDETIGHLALIGPLGHTFDTDSREPLFVTSSFIVRAPAALKPWSFLKLALRRVLVPELMEGFCGTPDDPGAPTLDDRYRRIEVNGKLPKAVVLDPSKLADVGEGTITLQSLAWADKSGKGVLSLKAGPKAVWSHELQQLSDTRWTLKDFGALPPGALQVEWEGDTKGKLPASVTSPSVRYVLKRLKERSLDKLPQPPLWEVALYVRLGAEQGWERLGHWRFDEPDDFGDGVMLELPIGLQASHHVAACEHRHSAYVDADWQQVLPDADTLPIGDDPWCFPEDVSSLRVRRYGCNTIKLIKRHDGSIFEPTKWCAHPAPAGAENQGLLHMLLVTRAVQSTDGIPSEFPVGLFQLVNRESFVPLAGEDPALGKTPSEHLRASVVIVRQRVREPIAFPTTQQDFWTAQTSDRGHDASILSSQAVPDARLQLLAIGTPISGVAD